MRWEEFWGAPPGVSRRKWQNLRTVRMIGVALVFVGFATSCLGVLGMLGIGGDDDVPIVPLADAASVTGERVRLQGRLLAKPPLAMPDDGTEVIRGRLRVSLEESGNRTPSEVLTEWDERATEVVLSDGTNELPVRVEALPMREDRRARGRLTQTATRGGQPERAEYGGETWEFDSEAYDHGSWRLDVERELLAHGETVVINGRVVDGVLVPTSGTRLDLSYGTATEVRENRGRGRMLMVCFGPLMLGLGLLLTILFSLKMAKERVAGAAKIGAMLGA